MSLYLKYRPRRFTDLIGQDHIAIVLSKALKKDRVAHAYLFFGPRGTGKTSVARLIAMSLTCENRNDGEACGQCSCCLEAKQGGLVDIIEIDGASNRGIDEIRDLKEKINFLPTRATKKIYIIDEVHMLTAQAFNALLKTLEEPPSHVHFILATTEIHKIPETIVSRCQRFDFRRVSDEDIVARLSLIAAQENLPCETEALFSIARVADGGMRDAIGLLEQLSHTKITATSVEKALGLSQTIVLENFYAAIATNRADTALTILSQAQEQGSDLYEFCQQYLQLLRRHLHQKIRNQENWQTLTAQIEIFQTAGEKLKNPLLPELPLEIAIAKSCRPEKTEAINSPTIAQVTKINLEEPQQTASPTDLTVKWHNFVSKIKNPALRMTAKEFIPLRLKENELLITTDSSFHLQQMRQSENLRQVESGLEEFWGQILKLELELSERSTGNRADLKTNGETTPTATANKMPETTSEPNKKDNVSLVAANMFGGTLL